MSDDFGKNNIVFEDLDGNIFKDNTINNCFAKDITPQDRVAIIEFVLKDKFFEVATNGETTITATYSPESGFELRTKTNLKQKDGLH